VYASPVRRAHETAEAIAAVAGVEVRVEPGVTEITIGATDDTMALRDRLAWLAMIAMRDGSWEGIPGTEPSARVRARMLGALDAIAARHRGERVAVVSHAGAINAALGAIAASPHDFSVPAGQRVGVGAAHRRRTALADERQRHVAPRRDPGPVAPMMQRDADTIDVRPEEALDTTRLEPYLRERLDGAGGAFELRQFGGGHANLTYLIRFGAREWVLRRPPLGPVAPGAHDMRREHRVLSTLHGGYPLAPQAYLLCTDHAIIGADFFVMERRHGIAFRRDIPAPWVDRPDVLRGVGESLIDNLARAARGRSGVGRSGRARQARRVRHAPGRTAGSIAGTTRSPPTSARPSPSPAGCGRRFRPRGARRCCTTTTSSTTRCSTPTTRRARLRCSTGTCARAASR
jgi:hypothetical protein